MPIDVTPLLPRVRELADEIEAGRRLPGELVEAFGRAGVWRACVPEQAGGLGFANYAELLGALGDIASADGSAGWCAMIGATSGLIYAFLDPAVSREIVRDDPSFCTGGVFAPSGRAVRTDDGLIVNGRWAFASGCQHSTWLGLGVVLEGADGTFDVGGVLVPASDVEILDTWHVSGLRGTGSNDVVLRDVFVPAERLYRLIGGSPKVSGALYALPVFGLLALGVAAVAVGIARGAIDDLIALATQKTPSGSRRRLADRSHAQMEVAQAEAELRAAEAFIANEVSRITQKTADGSGADLADRAGLRLAATHATRTSAKVVDRMYDLGGGTSIYASSRLQRAFRDVHAATQHMVVSPATYELSGRVLLGVETDVSQL